MDSGQSTLVEKLKHTIMYQSRYIQYLNLPPIPQEILDTVPRDFALYQGQTHGKSNTYLWSDSHNEHLNQWCQANICPDMYFGFQIITGNILAHKDVVTLTKISYLIESGGDNVNTEFFDDQHNLVASYKIESGRWHVLKADTYHSVSNIEPGQVRFSVTGRIF
jgi:hypothetical protein